MRWSDFWDYRTELKEEYQEYLQSEEWFELRSMVLRDNNYCCKLCDLPARDVHHLSYENLETEEEYFDLIPLCRNCHRQQHDKKRIPVFQKTYPTVNFDSKDMYVNYNSETIIYQNKMYSFEEFDKRFMVERQIDGQEGRTYFKNNKIEKFKEIQKVGLQLYTVT